MTRAITKLKEDFCKYRLHMSDILIIIGKAADIHERGSRYDEESVIRNVQKLANQCRGLERVERQHAALKDFLEQQLSLPWYRRLSLSRKIKTFLEKNQLLH